MINSSLRPRYEHEHKGHIFVENGCYRDKFIEYVFSTLYDMGDLDEAFYDCFNIVLNALYDQNEVIDEATLKDDATCRNFLQTLGHARLRRVDDPERPFVCSFIPHGEPNVKTLEVSGKTMNSAKLLSLVQLFRDTSHSISKAKVDKPPTTN